MDSVQMDIDDIKTELDNQGKDIPDFLTNFEYGYDKEKYVNFLGELAFKHTKELIQSAIKKVGFITAFNYAGGYSPKFYNYSGDVWDIELFYEIEHDTIQKWIDSKDQTELHNFLLDNFSSYDGFCSFIPNNIQSLLEETDSYKILVPILNFEISNIIKEKSDTDYYDDLKMDFQMELGESDMGDFLNEKSQELIHKIFKFREELGLI